MFITEDVLKLASADVLPRMSCDLPVFAGDTLNFLSGFPCFCWVNPKKVVGLHPDVCSNLNFSIFLGCLNPSFSNFGEFDLNFLQPY